MPTVSAITIINGQFCGMQLLYGRNGLIAGGGISNRNHVHFAPYEPHDGRVISGMRRLSCDEIALFADFAVCTFRLQLRGARMQEAEKEHRHRYVARKVLDYSSDGAQGVLLHVWQGGGLR